MPDEKPDVEIPTVKALDHKTIYTNATRVGLSNWDVRIIFSAAIEDANNKMVNQDLVTVLMAPAHAKAFVTGLEKQVAAYEEKFGALPDVMAIAAASKPNQKAEEPVEGSNKKPVATKKAKPH